MEIYIITITLSLFLSFVGMHCKTRVLQKICIGLIVVICSLMPGLRDISVGTDSLMYANFLVVDRSYHDWLVSGIAIEPGFVFLIKLLITYSSDDEYLSIFLFFKSSKARFAG